MASGSFNDPESMQTEAILQRFNQVFLTHNPAALHLDEQYCREHTEFGQRIVNSVFTLGLVVGISVGDTTLGTTVGNLGWDEVRFPRPVFHGDTIRAESEVLEAVLSSPLAKQEILHLGELLEDDKIPVSDIIGDVEEEEGQSDGDDPELVGAYEDVGLTWWIEKLGWFRGPVDFARRRIEQGPPAR